MLNSSLGLGRFLGSEVRLHSLFIAFMLLMTGAAYGRGGAAAAAWQAITMIGVFGSVLLHEYGHALAARCLGISTPTITLFPFGGIAFLDRLPRSPLAQLAIAIAGPAVSAAIAVGLCVAGFWKEGEVEPNTVEGFLEFLIFANMGITILNMVPAFPLDGGRVLKALLSMVMKERKALLAAVACGQIIAVLILALAAYSLNPMLAVIAAFVFLASAAEAGKHPFWLLGMGANAAPRTGSRPEEG